MSADLEIEPVAGLPAALPEGEHIVWQGRPTARGLAREAFSARWLVVYFTLLVGTRAALALHEGQGARAIVSSLPMVGLAAVCLGLVYLLALLNARAALYTITNKRVVMRIGVALPMTWNLPFRRIAAADLRSRATGDGDIVLTLAKPDRIGWLLLWPHAAPFRLIGARPTLRAIDDPERVATLLAQSVSAWSQSHAVDTRVQATMSRPAREAHVELSGLPASAAASR